MRILLTNDDGYDAPGLAALYDAVRGLGDVVIDVIAPAAAFSGKGHAVSPEVTCCRRQVSPFGEIVLVDGTPADCVRMTAALPGVNRPSWVIAGINRGGNLGADVYYSGTVAAAREAAIMGIPAIAVSQLVRVGEPDDWERSTREAAAVVAALVSSTAAPPDDCDGDVHDQAIRAVRAGTLMPDPPGFIPCWNVNLPKLPADKPPTGVRVAPLSTDPLPIAYEKSEGDEGSITLRYSGNYHQRAITPGTDVDVTVAGGIAISQLHVSS